MFYCLLLGVFPSDSP